MTAEKSRLRNYDGYWITKWEKIGYNIQQGLQD